MKTSEVEWMPGIPESWKTIRMPYAASVVSRDYQDEFDLLSVYLNRGVITYSEGGGLVHKPSEDLSKYQHVVPGDIVLNNQQAWRGSVGVSRHFGNVSPAYIVLRPTTDWHPGYLNYLLRSPFIVTQLEVASRGVGDIQRQLSRPWMRGILFPMPPLAEQRRIADFLDRETAKIDALIAKQEQLITTLDELRQAVISNVIMKGLDKNSTVSTTLVDHYEATPSSWSWVRLKDVAEVTPSNVDKKTYEGDISVSLCNYVDVYYNELISANLNFMSATATPDEIRKFELKRGWVIITKDSEDASDIGISAYVPEDLPNVVCGYHLSIVRPKVGVSGLFLKWFFDSTMTKGFMAKRANGLTRMALGQGAISTLPICLPPFVEQVEIANYLLETTTNVDDLIRTSRKTVDLLRERRQALISAAVTGKLEVAA